MTTLINRQERISLRTAGIALAVDASESPVGDSFCVWTENVSRSGMLLISEQPLDVGDRFLFRMLSNHYSQLIALCEVVRIEEREDRAYGVRTLSFVRRPDIDLSPPVGMVASNSTDRRMMDAPESRGANRANLACLLAD